MSFTITIHATGRGVHALAGREADGLTVTFEDGTLQKTFLSWKCKLLNSSWYRSCAGPVAA